MTTTETQVTRRPVIQQTRVHDYLYGKKNMKMSVVAELIMPITSSRLGTSTDVSNEQVVDLF